MQSSFWTPDAILAGIVLAVLGLIIGYLLAALIKNRAIQRATVELEQARQERTASAAQHAALQTEQSESRAQLQQVQLRENRLQAQLEAAVDTQSRLDVELRQARETTERLRGELAEEGRKARGFEASNHDVRAQLEEYRQRLDAAEHRYASLLEQFRTLDNQHTQLRTTLSEREESHAREVANFERQKASLSEQFRVMSNEILDAKTRALQESSKLSLGSIMTPFQQSINSFKEEVQRIHYRETLQQGELRKELQQLMDLNQKITTEAHALSTALRGQKKLQGNWGELVLENLLDRSGLQLGKDYRREVSFNTEEGRKRPDAIVYLPQGKHLIVDAKVSLNAYTRYVNAEDEQARALALKEHVQAMADRIRELADRAYYRLPGLNSPAMVFMFVPIESAFVEALKADETLFQQAIEQNVLVATPTTLLTSLNIVRQLWRYEDQNKTTAELAKRAESVFRKLNSFLQSFEKIKRSLDSASDAYSRAEGQLVSGRGNLVKQVGEFKNLTPAIRADLPDYFTEKAALEADFTTTVDAADDTAEHAAPADSGQKARQSE